MPNYKRLALLKTPLFSSLFIIFAPMVLVTGGTGLIGSHLLLHLLKNGERVRALYRNKEKLSKVAELFKYYKSEYLYLSIEWVEGDITDISSIEESFEQIDEVYHCAGYVSFDPKKENLLRKINIEGTANLINLAIDYKVRKFCFISSTATLEGSSDQNLMIKEETEWSLNERHSDYAITKYGAEIEVWRGQEEGLSTVIVNPGIVLGPGFWDQGSGSLFKAVSRGLKYYPGGSSGFIAVTDLADILFRLMKKDLNGERFILVAENISFQQILNIIANALKTKTPKFCITPWIASLICIFNPFLSIIISSSYREGLKGIVKYSHTKKYYSNEKIKNTLDYHFTDIKDYIHTIAYSFSK